MDLDTLLNVTMTQITEFMEAERSTLFLYDEARDELWSRLAQGRRVGAIRRKTEGIEEPVIHGAEILNLMDSRRDIRFTDVDERDDFDSYTRALEIEEIRISADDGIAGAVMQSGESLIIDDAYEDERFNRAIDAKTGYRTRTVLCVPLIDANNKRIGVIQVLNKHDGLFNERDEKLLRALAAQAAVAIENARLYDNLRDLRKNEQLLNETLQNRHKELQAAYYQIEGANENLKTALRKVSLVRTLSLLFAGAVIVVVMLYDWSGSLFQDFRADNAPPPMVDDNPSFFVVSPQPVQDTIQLTGRIHPLEVVNIVSPLSGKISKRHVNYGDLVENGQPLLEVDTTTTEIRYRDARAAYLKAQEKLEVLQNWENSTEMSDIRRNLVRIRLEQENLQQKLIRDKRRVALGIISREEYELAKQALVQLNLERQAAEQTLVATLAKADARQIQLAELALQNTAQKVADLEAVLSQSVIKAPVSGVLTWPEMPGDKNREPKNIEAGIVVNEGDTLFSIGNMEGIAVKSRVDEVDVRKLHKGQLVRVSGDAFPDMDLTGELTNIASQADSVGQRTPFFTITVQVKRLRAWQRDNLRLGMSADLAVLVYEKSNALLVPIGSVSSDDESWYVKVKDRATRGLRRVRVKTGVTNQDKVEILEGLQQGDEVLIPN